MSILSLVTDPVTSKIKLIGWAIGAGFLAALVALGWYFWHDYQKDKTDLNAAKVQNATLQGTNKNLDDTIQKNEQSKKVDDATQATVDTTNKKVDQKAAEIKKDYQKDVKTIEQKYADQPQTQANLQQKEQDMSAARMRRLWQVFCIPDPTTKDCAANINSSAASAAVGASAASN